MKLRHNVLLVFFFSVCFTAYLGFSDISLSNDKLLHYLVFLFMTTLFYWLFDSATTRVIMNLTLIICTVAAGIGSEFIQSLVSSRKFDIWDIVSNILGSLTGLVLSVYYHKRQLKIRRNQRYQDLRDSIPAEINEDHDFENGLESGYQSSNSSQLNDLSRFTSTDNIPLKNVEPEPIDDLEVE